MSNESITGNKCYQFFPRLKNNNKTRDVIYAAVEDIMKGYIILHNMRLQHKSMNPYTTRTIFIDQWTIGFSFVSWLFIVSFQASFGVGGLLFFALKAIWKHEIGKTPQNRCARPTSSIVKANSQHEESVGSKSGGGCLGKKRKVEVEKIDVHVDWRYVDACW